MNPAPLRLALYSGLFSALMISLTRLLNYIEGRHFDRYLIRYPMSLAVLLSVVTFLVAGSFCAYHVMRRQVPFAKVRWLLTVPVALGLSVGLSFPTFSDGMRDTLESKGLVARLHQYAADARKACEGVDPYKQDEPLSRLVAERYPEFEALSKMRLHLRVTEEAVNLSWGGALIGHWFIAIGKKPFPHAPADYMKDVELICIGGDVWLCRDAY